MRFVCISDTHGHHRKIDVPTGDVLIHAGDFTGANSYEELKDFNNWMSELPHPIKVFVAGNHDWCFQTKKTWARLGLTSAIYLEDSAYTIGKYKLYGSPWQPRFYDWAFNLSRGEAIKEKWDLIPNDTDILITHGPPAGFGDYSSRGDRVGCQDLAKAIERVKPKAHICGHNHEGYGILEKNGIIYANVSICTERYIPTNPPVVIDL